MSIALCNDPHGVVVIFGDGDIRSIAGYGEARCDDGAAQTLYTMTMTQIKDKLNVGERIAEDAEEAGTSAVLIAFRSTVDIQGMIDRLTGMKTEIEQAEKSS